MSHAFRSYALIALGALLTACSPSAPDPKVLEALRDYDAAAANIVRGMKATPGPLGDLQDFRGLTHAQEMGRRVMTPDTRKRLAELRARAEKATNPVDARVPLDEARLLLAKEAKLAFAINAYWTQALPAPYWRKYWNDFFVANDEPVAQPDPMLSSIEQRVREAIDRGEYQRATEEAQMLPPVLAEALNRAAGGLAKPHLDKAVFVARRTPCPPGAPPDHASGKPRIVPSTELESFYPRGPKNLGLQGTTVLRVKVDREGCGKEVAIAVRSGLPELDQAALSWFETAQFAPAWKGGRTIESGMAFKVRFQITDKPIPNDSRP